ncbi:alpha/beta hydrolase [Streptomyces antimycoticus]|uniref:alpha/beta fold hydrolase n=1 Tax=Streptomyces antimycoticus TaxID=68175 RepID=UPI003428D420
MSVRGVDFAHRQLGPEGDGVPLILLHHLTAVLDNWDPRVIDGLATRRRVIAFDNRGVGASGGYTPDTIEAMAGDAVLFIRALGFEQVDLPGLSMGGFIAQVIAAEEPQLVRRVVLAGTGPAGRPRHRQGHRTHPPGHREGPPAPQGPQAVPLLHRYRARPTRSTRLPGTAEGAHRARTPSTSPHGCPGPNSSPSTRTPDTEASSSTTTNSWQKHSTSSNLGHTGAGHRSARPRGAPRRTEGIGGGSENATPRIPPHLDFSRTVLCASKINHEPPAPAEPGFVLRTRSSGEQGHFAVYHPSPGPRVGWTRGARQRGRLSGGRDGPGHRTGPPPDRRWIFSPGPPAA